MGHRPECPLGQGRGAVDGLEFEHPRLQVGREQKKIEQLRHPGAREPEVARDGSPVGTESPVDGPLEVCAGASPRAMCATREMDLKWD